MLIKLIKKNLLSTMFINIACVLCLDVLLLSESFKYPFNCCYKLV